MFRRFFSRIYFLCFLFISGVVLIPVDDAWGIETLNVRSGVHKGYTRLVFDWPASVTYSIERMSQTKIAVHFSKAAKPKLSKFQSAKLPYIKSLEQSSKTGDPLTVELVVQAGSDIRKFKSGTHVVIDIVKPTKRSEDRITQALKKRGAQKPIETVDENPLPAPEKNVVEKTENSQPPVKALKKLDDTNPTSSSSKKPGDLEDQKESSVNVKPVQVKAVPASIEQTKPDEKKVPKPQSGDVSQNKQSVEPDVSEEISGALLSEENRITMTSIEPFSLAGYFRNGFFWLVVANDSGLIPLQFDGPLASEIEKEYMLYSIPRGTLYRFEIPENDTVKISGGKLFWTIEFRDRQISSLANVIKPIISDETLSGSQLSVRVEDPDQVLVFSDPDVGDNIQVLTTNLATNDNIIEPQSYPEFSVLESTAGLAVQIESDAVNLQHSETEGLVSKAGGIIRTKLTQVDLRRMKSRRPDDGISRKSSQVLAFNQKHVASREFIHRIRHEQEVEISGLKDKERVEGFNRLAELYLMSGFSHESLGFYRVARDTIPRLEKIPTFVARRGVARALSGKTEDALRDLNNPILRKFPDLDIWRAYAHGRGLQWTEGYELLPVGFREEMGYPQEIRVEMAIIFAEMGILNGDVELARNALEEASQGGSILKRRQMAAIDYLRGEIFRQENKTELAIDLWKQVARGSDRMYRTKAGISLTDLQMELEEITEEKAIDRMENLRYAWRGDRQEIEIMLRLGQLYLDKGAYRKGLNILKDVRNLIQNPEEKKRISEDMEQTFISIFSEDGQKNVPLSPMDAVTIYSEFRVFTPGGREGDRLIGIIIDHLVSMDLLSRAEDMMHKLIKRMKRGKTDYSNIALKLAEVYLFDRKPSLTIRVLNNELKNLELSDQHERKAAMLRARALSELKHPDAAFNVLEKYGEDPEVLYLYIDVARKSGKWSAAADAIDILLARAEKAYKENPDNAQLKKDIVGLVMKRAVALNLSGNLVELSLLREVYEPIMRAQNKGKLFMLLTRPHNDTKMADKGTLLEIIDEVNMFSDFVKNYKNEVNETVAKAKETIDGNMAVKE